MERKEIFYLIALSFVYIVISTPLLHLPGVHDEESFLVMNAASIVLTGTPWCAIASIFGIPFPLMMHEHTGIISTFSYILPFYLFGVNVISMRMTRIFIGLICLFLTYWFTRLYFNKKTALLTSFLMGTLPFYVFFFRHGYLDDGFNLLIMLICLISFFYFNKTHNFKFLYFSFLSLGIGLSNKLNFVWFIFGIAITFFIFRKKFNINSIKKRQIFFAFLFFIIGAFPFIAYNFSSSLKNDWGNNTLEEIFARLVYPRYLGNNLDVLNNFKFRLLQVKEFLNNDFDFVVKFNNFIYFPIFIIVFFTNLFFLKKSQFKIKFFYVLIGIMFFQSLFTITVLRVEHFAIFFSILFSLFSFGLFNILYKKKVLFFSVLFLLTLMNFLTLASSYDLLNKRGAILPQQYGGWHFPTDSIYFLVDYLSEKKINPISLGSGLSTNIPFLSNYNVSSQGCENEFNFEECINMNESNYYIIKVHFLTEKWWHKFKDELNKNDKSVVIEKVFYTRDMLPEIVLFYIIDEQNIKDVEKIDNYFKIVLSNNY